MAHKKYFALFFTLKMIYFYGSVSTLTFSHSIKFVFVDTPPYFIGKYTFLEITWKFKFQLRTKTLWELLKIWFCRYMTLCILDTNTLPKTKFRKYFYFRVMTKNQFLTSHFTIVIVPKIFTSKIVNSSLGALGLLDTTQNYYQSTQNSSRNQLVALSDKIDHTTKIHANKTWFLRVALFCSPLYFFLIVKNNIYFFTIFILAIVKNYTLNEKVVKIYTVFFTGCKNYIFLKAGKSWKNIFIHDLK